MNKKIILAMGLPLVVRNSKGKKATIELNNSACVVCRFHPNNSVYLGDAQLEKWFPANFFFNLIYRIKKYRQTEKQK